MATKAKPAKATSGRDASVEEFMRIMDHPMKKEIEAVRQLILATDPSIIEGIKWNGVSFLTSDHFATLNNTKNPRTQDHVALILHTGVKAKGLMLQDLVADPAGLLTWVAKDRCILTFTGTKDIKVKQAALQAIIRQWISHLS